jgi:hypothetical protein
VAPEPRYSVEEISADDKRERDAAELLDEGERSQISEHLDMTPRERLDRLLDLLAFEARARRARVVRKLVP